MIQSGHRELHSCLKHRYVYNRAVGTGGRARNGGSEAHRAETTRCDGAREQGLPGSDSWTNAANSGAPAWSSSSLPVAQYVYIHIYIHLYLVIAIYRTWSHELATYIKSKGPGRAEATRSSRAPRRASLAVLVERGRPTSDGLVPPCAPTCYVWPWKKHNGTMLHRYDL